MSEAKDPAIKLFGKTIQLPEAPAAAMVASECGVDASALSNDISADDTLVQDHPSSPNSLPEDSNPDRNGAEEESDKVPT
ncbi:unnamed protein product [Coffea canephora]|uniref:Uncharacterized protein n=1 Tax=Coffea canephora TaxID=49390 RepID=A0A068V1L6_COFCA|nr:unnamed protein product [Coffea canephora]